MQNPDGSDFDWNSEEGKQATARLNRFVEHIDKSAAHEGLVRKVVPIGKSDSGEELKIVTWGKP